MEQLVACAPWAGEVPGSSPGTPTKNMFFDIMEEDAPIAQWIERQSPLIEVHRREIPM